MSLKSIWIQIFYVAEEFHRRLLLNDIGKKIGILHQKLFKDESNGTKVREFMEPLHTASRFGVIGKSVYLIVVLFGASLPVTGLYIWLGRKKKKKK